MIGGELGFAHPADAGQDQARHPRVALGSPQHASLGPVLEGLRPRRDDPCLMRPGCWLPSSAVLHHCQAADVPGDGDGAVGGVGIPRLRDPHRAHGGRAADFRGRPAVAGHRSRSVMSVGIPGVGSDHRWRTLYAPEHGVTGLGRRAALPPSHEGAGTQAGPV